MKVKNVLKNFILIGCVASMTVGMFSCTGKNEKPEDKKIDYSVNLPDLGGKEPMPGYSYLCGSYENPGSSVPCTKEKPAGILIDVSDKCFLSTLSAVVNYAGSDEIKLNLEIYSWKDDYAKTVAEKAVYKSEASVNNPGGRITAYIERGAISNGKFLCLFKNDAEIDIAFQIKPCGDAAEKVFATDFYSGDEKLDFAYRSFVTYYDYNEGVSAEQTEKTKVSKDKAHVILILGQSNATGQALCSYLKQTSTAEDYARYEKGYENVKIFYAVDSGSNTSKNKFVPVTLGQGNSKEKFGPEIGMAEVLTEKYPDETFYIIKASCSGAGLSKHFQDSNGEYRYCMSTVSGALKKLKNEGLDPEVFAVIWMQGETDAMYYQDSVTYAEKQDDFIKRVAKKVEKYSAENGFTFIDAEIAEANCWTSREVVNVSKEICDLKDVNRVYLKTTGLGTYKENNDIAHYDSQDNISLGKLFGNAVLDVYKFD